MTIHDERNIDREPSLQDASVEDIHVFDMKTMRQVIKEASGQPPLKQLCSSLLYENDLCLIFSDTNVGKTLFAMDIANMIASGEELSPYHCDAKPQKVLYLDCEMSDGQLYRRYSDRIFHENLIRATISAQVTHDIVQYMAVDTIEQYCANNDCHVVFIDNITALGSTVDVEDATDIILKLKALTKKNITVVVICHTPKIEANQPLVRESMGGAKVLSNLCDSIVGLARTRQGYRYVKQLKTRMTRDYTDTDTLDFFSITDTPYLHFQHEGQDTETTLLYGKRREEFFHSIWGDDKTKTYTLKELVTLIINNDNSKSKNKDHNARNRIDSAVKSGVLTKLNNSIKLTK